MARISEQFFETKVGSVIRGHHIYKETWTPFVGEVLEVKPDMRNEARDHDPYAMGIYMINADEEEQLVGHVPIEISSLLYHFLNHGDSIVRVKVTGPRRNEKGLVVPGMYELYTKCKNDAVILDKELIKRKERFDIDYTPKTIFRAFPFPNE